jgi:hypothetical protein
VSIIQNTDVGVTDRISLQSDRELPRGAIEESVSAISSTAFYPHSANCGNTAIMPSLQVGYAPNLGVFLTSLKTQQLDSSIENLISYVA